MSSRANGVKTSKVSPRLYDLFSLNFKTNKKFSFNRNDQNTETKLSGMTYTLKKVRSKRGKIAT